MAIRATKAEYKNSLVRDLEEDIFNEAVQGRGGGHWAGTLFGLGYGLLAGAAIGLVPGFFVAGGFAALTWQGVVGTAAALGTLGALQGRSAGSENGSAAGAAVGSTKVLLTEMRQQFKGLKQEIDQVKDRLDMPADLKDAAQTADTSQDAVVAEQSATQNRSGYVKWRTAIVSTLLGAVVGLLAFAAASLTGVNVIGDMLGKIGFDAAMAPLGAALIGGASGGFFGFNVPLITSKMHMTARETINQRIFESEEVTPSKNQEIERAPDLKQATVSTDAALDKDALGINVERLMSQRAKVLSVSIRGATS